MASSAAEERNVDCAAMAVESRRKSHTTPATRANVMNIVYPGLRGQAQRSIRAGVLRCGCSDGKEVEKRSKGVSSVFGL